MTSFRVGLTVLALMTSASVALAETQACTAKAYAGRWLVTAGRAMCVVKTNNTGAISSTSFCYYGTLDKPITITGNLKIGGSYPCSVDGWFSVKGARGALFARYKVIATGLGGTQIAGFLKAGRALEGFTLSRTVGPEQ